MSKGEQGVRKRVTLAEIARAAGVSVGLVSAYLSGRNYDEGSSGGIRIGAETGRRILLTCRRLGYQPERAATYRLIYPELSPIGMVGSINERFYSNRYHSMILDGVIGETSSMSVGLNMLQYDPGMDYEAHPEELPDWAREGEIHRFIFAGVPNESLLRTLVRRGSDVVYASRDPGVSGVSVVVPDYAAAAGLALRYLRDRGHCNVGLFGLPYFHATYQAVELLRGARAALNDLGMEEILFLEADRANRHDQPARALRSFLGRTPPVTAIFAFDDLSAETLARAAREQHLRIPDDFSLIGCNDERQSVLLNPPLTTVHLPVTEIGRKAVEILGQLALDPGSQTAGRRLVLPVYLVERASAEVLKR